MFGLVSYSLPGTRDPVPQLSVIPRLAVSQFGYTVVLDGTLDDEPQVMVEATSQLGPLSAAKTHASTPQADMAASKSQVGGHVSGTPSLDR